MRNKNNNESGAALVLATFCIVLLVGFAGLAFELTMAGASNNQSLNNAKLASLAALEAYSAADGTHDEKMREAVAAANTASGWNRVIGVSSGGVSSQVTEDNDGLDSPKLIPGRYFPVQNPDGSNPCSDGDEAPCFREVEAGELANAFQVQGPLYGGYRTKFLSVFGQEGLESARVNATASTVPRLGCFVVDLSNSMTQETHAGFRSETSETPLYAYKMPEHQTHFDTLEANRPAGNSSDRTKHYQSDYEAVTPLTDIDYASNPDFAKYHPSPVTDPKYSATRLEGNYLVDQYVDANYQGPEPLTTVFKGINNAIKQFRERAVVGDRACIVFHDDTLAWPRITKLTDDFDYLERLTDTTKYTTTDGAGNVVLDTTRGLGRMLRHGFFPAYLAATDLKEATAEAMFQFQEFADANPGFPTSNFIVLIGDGLTNCSNCDQIPIPDKADLNGDGRRDFWTETALLTSCIGGPTTGQELTIEGNLGNTVSYHNTDREFFCDPSIDYDINDDGFVNSGDTEYLVYQTSGSLCGGGNREALAGCSNTFDHHRVAWRQFYTYVGYSVAPSRTPVHVVATGAHIMPHTTGGFSRRGGGGQTFCLTDAQKRSENTPGARGENFTMAELETAFNNMSPSQPFTAINGSSYNYGVHGLLDGRGGLYEVSEMTGGIWAPLRPGSDHPDGCTEVDYCSIGQYGEASTVQIPTDPECRTSQQQMDAYMAEIMGVNPFVIVSVD